MKERLEQLSQIQKLCAIEVQQIKSNADKISVTMKKLTEQLEKTWRDDKNTLSKFDTLMTSLTNFMDYGRKINLQLELHSNKLSGLYEMFCAHQNYLSKDKYTDRTSNIINGSDKYIYPAEEYDSKEEIDVFEYPKLLLNDMYREGDILNAIITYIEDINSLSFYIFDKSSPYGESIVELSKCMNLRQYYSMPPANEIFGYVLEQHIFRAVRNSKIFFDVEMEDEICPVYLLDTGEIVSMKKSENVTYKLTDKLKAIPGLAIMCKINYSKKNPFIDVEKVQRTLKELEQNECRLKIVGVENNILCVELVDDYQSPTKTTHEKDGKHKVITEEELEILNEEPFCTSNAMKAVMGYDPQDDKRICRFYNPETGACFKGSNCKLEHSLRQPDGWTKDILPSATIVENLHPIKIFPTGSIINIIPTYIECGDRFYSQINDTNEISPPLVWNDEDIPTWRRLQKPPHMFDLVLSRYNDGLWYRAKIMFHDDEYKTFKVFYVDYGNHQVVHLKELAKIESSMAKLPFKAVLCRIASVREKKNISPENRQKCIQLLCDMILNKSIDVKVVSHYEDLFISFFTNKEFPIPDILIQKGYLQMKPN